jgi:hypothetical protein
MSLQRIALTHSPASTIQATCFLPIGAAFPEGTCGRPKLGLPMHQLFDAKGGVMRIQAVLRLVFIVPFTQQLVFCCFVCWLGSLLSKSFVNATRTSAVILHILCNFSLPLIAADRALPLSPVATVRKHLLRCLDISVMIPVSCLSRCFGSKRAVLTCCFPLTVWAFPASNYKSASTHKVSWAGSRRCADCAELLVKLLRSNTLTKFSVKFAQNCNLVCWSCLGP